MEWRTIDSAPRDGTKFLAYGKFYHIRGWTGWREGVDKDHPVAYGFDVDISYFSGGNWQSSRLCGFEPTQWQPLPAPPKE